MKIAAYQAPLSPAGSMAALAHIRARVQWCEAAGVGILCCPEAILGGLADSARDPHACALDANSGQLDARLAPLASESVTTIVGFTESSGSALFNSAAVFQRGRVVGVYRKHHPAIRRSIYQPGDRATVFTVGALTFGIIICNDSNFPEPARQLAVDGARILFVPSNNALPPHKADVVDDARAVDIGHATTLGVWVMRADVAGRCGELRSHGASGIVDPRGIVRHAAAPFEEQLIVAEIE
jgi:5-aminopentanamidase